jgi:hypothetical protein
MRGPFKHGYARGELRGHYPPVYAIWQAMLNRCRNPRVKNYHRYGGRGIQVCAEWHSFENFLRDMGEPPRGASLERIDNDQDYRKDNCIWADKHAQANNTHTNKFIDYKGRTQTLAQWVRELGLDYKRTYRRITRYRWTIDEAFETHERLPHRKSKA